MCNNEVPNDFLFCVDCAEDIVKTWPKGWKPELKLETLPEVKSRLDTFGFLHNKNTKFWRVRSIGQFKNLIGMEIGRFIHSCHIDSTDFIVLFFIKNYNNKNEIGYFSDNWLTEITS